MGFETTVTMAMFMTLYASFFLVLAGKASLIDDHIKPLLLRRHGR